MTAFDRVWDLMKNDWDEFDLADFLPGANMNPHFDPDYPPEDDNLPCETESCPNPARTGPMHYSGGYIGKVTACNECWQAIVEHLEEEQAIEDSDDDRPTWDD